MLWTYSDFSPEQVYAHRIADRELARYWQEFARWRMRMGYNTGPINDLRIKGERFPPLMQQRHYPEPDQKAQR